MKNTVTFETAIAMKEAGFPQPEPAPGQFWYDFNGRLFIVYYEGGEGNCFLSLENGDSFPCVEKGGYVFAPTAIDILEQLPGDDIGYYPVNSEGWVSFSDYGETTNEDKNPHELAAKLYFLNKAGK